MNNKNRTAIMIRLNTEEYNRIVEQAGRERRSVSNMLLWAFGAYMDRIVAGVEAKPRGDPEDEPQPMPQGDPE